MVGSHDKSDWILYKTNNLSEEIAASRDDVVNKTTCPLRVLEVLEPSTEYTLKLRYHDATNDVWSEQGNITFTTKYVFNRPNIDPVVSTNGIHFTVGSRRLNNVDLFLNKWNGTYHNWVSTSDFKVIINNKETNQSLFRITAEIGDTVLIKPVRDDAKFPVFCPIYGGEPTEDGDYNNPVRLDSILEPLPVMWKNSSSKETDLSHMFSYYNGYGRFGIKNICERLFFNNESCLDFTSCFGHSYQVQDYVTSFPEILFSDTSKATNLSYFFTDSHSGISIPTNIFAPLKNIENCSYMFSNCSDIKTDGIRFTSKNITNVKGFADSNLPPITVFVPKDSVTAQTFKNTPSANVYVIEE